jgi:hypothetical protein
MVIDETPVVLIEWQDIVGMGSGWVTHQEIMEAQPATMVTVGWVLRETEDFLVVGATVEIGGDGQLGDVSVIPKAVVVRRLPLGA